MLIQPFAVQTLELKLKKGEMREQLILIWTKIFGEEITHVNIHKGCPEPFNRCRMTTDRSLIEESDAVIFHARDINFTDDMPTFRSAEQRWGFFFMESPIHTGQEEEFRNLSPKFRFNMTLTYR